MSKKRYSSHPYADLFPLHEGQPLWDLSASIKANGLEEPIILLDGKILDGRRRQLACDRAGVPPRYREYKGRDPLEFVVSKNLHRRHLGEAERAMIAAALTTARIGRQESNGSYDPSEKTCSNGRAARMMNVSTISVKRAKKVKKDGTKKLKRLLADKLTTLFEAATAAAETPEVQDAAVALVRDGAAKTMAEAIAQVKPKPEPKQPKDDDGVIIPEEALEAFENAEQVEALCRALDTISQNVEKVAKLPGGEQIHASSIAQSIKNVRQTLFQSRATHVCPYCDGKDSECAACKGLFWTTKAIWSASPKIAARR